MNIHPIPVEGRVHGGVNGGVNRDLDGGVDGGVNGGVNGGVVQRSQFSPTVRSLELLPQSHLGCGGVNGRE